ncbi:AGAL3 [Symbiodinium sp. KB8]|nr:AGAL3 [Symbiodinium sp. KB8]
MEGAADALVASGLAAVGYNYLNVDDCWAESRNATGYVQADASTFPSGMGSLAAYAHSRGLKFGLYSDAGSKTCAGRPGSLGYESKDAASYAAWGVDYLKYDNCNNEGIPPRVRYPPMRDALNSSGRSILFSMCEWGVDQPAFWAPGVGNSWRTTPDIKDFWLSMMFNLELTEPSYLFAGPGGWNDPDMLEVGNGGMKHGEYVAHFSLWALIKAPLLIGCDLNDMSEDTLSILNNTEVIALNQDALGVAGHRVASSGTFMTPVSGDGAGGQLSMQTGRVDGYLDSSNTIVTACARASSPALRGGAQAGPAWGKTWFQRTHGRRVRSAGLVQGGTPAAQTWTIGATGHIVSALNQQCLSVDHCAKYTWGDNVSVGPCDGHGNEADDSASATCDGKQAEWKYDPTTGHVTAGNNGQCLTAVDIATTSTLGVRNAVTLPCSSSTPGQVWKWDATAGALHPADDAEQCLTVFQDVPTAERSVWAAPLADGSVGVVLYNVALQDANITLNMQDAGFTSGQSVNVRDLWAHRDVGTFRDTFTALTPGHGVVALRLTPQ